MRHLGIIQNAGLIIENGKISFFGRMEDLPQTNYDELDCSGKIVLPGFVDSHTHLLFAGTRENEFELRCSGATYQEIAEKGGGILSTVQKTREAAKKELKKNARRYINAMLRYGTTTVEIKTGYGLNFETEIKMLEAIRELQKEEIITICSTFLGAHAIPPEYKNNPDAYIDEICNNMIPYVSRHNLADFCDVFCENGYFNVTQSEKILSVGKKFGLAPKIHAEELSTTGGAILAGKLKATSADHLEHIDENGINAMRDGEVVAVLLPGVSFFLNHRYAPARKLIESGIPVAIASDFNPGSCMSYSMPLMMTIACTQMHMLPEEAITASTINSAAALNLSEEIGSIDIGKFGDVVVFDVPDYRFLIYHFGENHIYRVIKNGVMLEF